jgi:hypothetical protein
LPGGLAVSIVIGVLTSRSSWRPLIRAACESRSALPTGKNLLLLLIAILAVLVAVGVLSG